MRPRHAIPTRAGAWTALLALPLACSSDGLPPGFEVGDHVQGVQMTAATVSMQDAARLKPIGERVEVLEIVVLREIATLGIRHPVPSTQPAACMPAAFVAHRSPWRIP